MFLYVFKTIIKLRKIYVIIILNKISTIKNKNNNSLDHGETAED